MYYRTRLHAYAVGVAMHEILLCTSIMECSIAKDIMLKDRSFVSVYSCMLGNNVVTKVIT